MIGENIKAYRKQKGYSQETLALQLSVVRQTVSKWEKGLSVPDAEMLEKLAEVLEVSTSELLGRQETPEAQPSEMSDISNQLAILNENLAQQQRSRKRTLQIVKRVLLGVLIAIALTILITFIAAHMLTFQNDLDETRLTTTKITCTVDGKPHSYTILSDGKQTILSATGSPWFDETFQADGYYGHAGEYLVDIHDYCLENDIPCEIVESESRFTQTTTKITCTVDGETHRQTIRSDVAGTILSVESSPWFLETFPEDGCSLTAHEHIETILDYCQQNNIPCEVDNTEQP